MQTNIVFRFHELGFATKAVAGAIVIVITWLSLPLGFVAFGGFLFLHLLLRPIQRGTISSDGLVAPIDGMITDVRQDGAHWRIELLADSFQSQLIYAPIKAVVSDKLWIDGDYLAHEEEASEALNARYEYQLSSPEGSDIIFTIYGARWTRLLHMPFSEGQAMVAGEPFGYGLLRSHVAILVPYDSSILVQKGQACLAKQTILASL